MVKNYKLKKTQEINKVYNFDDNDDNHDDNHNDNDSLHSIYDKNKSKINIKKTNKKNKTHLFNKRQQTKKRKKKNQKLLNSQKGGSLVGEIIKTTTKMKSSKNKLNTIKSNLIKEQNNLLNTFHSIFKNVSEVLEVKKQPISNNQSFTNYFNDIHRRYGNININYLYKIYKTLPPKDFGKLASTRVIRWPPSNYHREITTKTTKGKHFYSAPYSKMKRARAFADETTSWMGKNFLRNKTLQVDRFVGSKIDAVTNSDNEHTLHIKMAKYRERELQYLIFKKTTINLIARKKKKIDTLTEQKEKDEYLKASSELKTILDDIDKLIIESPINSFINSYKIFNIHRILINPPIQKLASKLSKAQNFIDLMQDLRTVNVKKIKKYKTFLKKLNESNDAVFKYFGKQIEKQLSDKMINIGKTTTPYHQIIIDNKNIHKLLFEIKTLFIYKDFDKPYLDMGQISLIKMFQTDRYGLNTKQGNKGVDFFIGDDVDSCYPILDKKLQMTREYYLKEVYKHDNFVFQDLLQVPKFIENYLILKMIKQPLPSIDGTPLADFPPIDNDMIKLEYKFNLESQDILKKKKDFNTIYEDNFNDLTFFKKDASEKIIKIYLPLSSFLAMVKPASLIFAQSTEFSQPRLNKINKIRNEFIRGTAPLHYFHAYYTKETPTILPGTIRYIYDTIANILYYLFSTEKCSFQRIYLDDRTITHRENTLFKRDYLTKIKIIKNYGFYKGYITDIICIMYIMTIYMDHLSILLKHLQDLIFITKQLKQISPELSKKYNSYYEEHYKKKKDIASKPSDPLQRLKDASSYKKYYEDFYDRILKKTKSSDEDIKYFYRDFKNISKINIGKEDIQEDLFLNTSFSLDNKCTDNEKVFMNKDIDINTITDIKFKKLIYILYVDYHDKKVPLRTIQYVLLKVLIDNICKKESNIKYSGPQITYTKFNNVSKIYHTVFNDHKTTEIKLLDYIDYYYYNYYVFNTQYYKMLSFVITDDVDINKIDSANAFKNYKNIYIKFKLKPLDNTDNKYPVNLVSAVQNLDNAALLKDMRFNDDLIKNIFEYIKTEYDISKLGDDLKTKIKENPMYLSLTILYLSKKYPTFIKDVKIGADEAANIKRFQMNFTQIEKTKIFEGKRKSDFNKELLEFLFKYKNYFNKDITNRNIPTYYKDTKFINLPIFDVIYLYFRECKRDLASPDSSNMYDNNYVEHVKYLNDCLTNCMFLVYDKKNTIYYDTHYLEEIQRFFDSNTIYLDPVILIEIKNCIDEVIKKNKIILDKKFIHRIDPNNYRVYNQDTRSFEGSKAIFPTEYDNQHIKKDIKNKILENPHDANNPTFILNNKEIHIKNIPKSISKQIIISTMPVPDINTHYTNLSIAVTKYNESIYKVHEHIYFFKLLKEENLKNLNLSYTGVADNTTETNKLYPCQLFLLQDLMCQNENYNEKYNSEIAGGAEPDVRDEHYQNEENVDQFTIFMDSKPELFDYSKGNKNKIFSDIISDEGGNKLISLANETIISKMVGYLNNIKDGNVAAPPPYTT